MVESCSGGGDHGGHGVEVVEVLGAVLGDGNSVACEYFFEEVRDVVGAVFAVFVPEHEGWQFGVGEVCVEFVAEVFGCAVREWVCHSFLSLSLCYFFLLVCFFRPFDVAVCADKFVESRVFVCDGSVVCVDGCWDGVWGWGEADVAGSVSVVSGGAWGDVCRVGAVLCEPACFGVFDCGVDDAFPECVFCSGAFGFSHEESEVVCCEYGSDFSAFAVLSSGCAYGFVSVAGLEVLAG